MATSTSKPTMPYWHVYVDEDGISRQERFDLSAFELKGINPAVEPQWNDKMEPSKAGVTFTVLPVGWVGEWHENPKPQWIAILTGRWFVETMDGMRIEMGPGELMMGEDQGTTDGQGHRSGTVGDQPCTMIVTALDVTPTVGRPRTLHVKHAAIQSEHDDEPRAMTARSAGVGRPGRLEQDEFRSNREFDLNS